MIVIDKPRLKFLLAGRAVKLVVPSRQQPYRPHRPYAVGTSHRNTICHAEVLSTLQTADGLELELRQVSLDQPNLLAARSEYGYTTNPHQAMSDEPEAIPKAVQGRFSEAARTNYSVTHADELAKREAKSLAGQLKAARARALARGVDVTPEMAAIRAQLDKINSKLRDAA